LNFLRSCKRAECATTTRALLKFDTQHIWRFSGSNLGFARFGVRKIEHSGLEQLNESSRIAPRSLDRDLRFSIATSLQRQIGASIKALVDSPSPLQTFNILSLFSSLDTHTFLHTHTHTVRSARNTHSHYFDGCHLFARSQPASRPSWLPL